MAEREGFEPSDQLPSRILSKDVLSATQPPLQETMAEGERFELSVGCPTMVFKTTAFDRSAIPPDQEQFPSHSIQLIHVIR